MLHKFKMFRCSPVLGALVSKLPLKWCNCAWQTV
jgi:hypothetical protein